MRYVAAYLLAVLGGNASPSAGDIKKILESAGIGYDQEHADLVVKKLKGKDLNELMAEGRKKMSSMPSGGAAPAAAGGTAAAAAKVETKEEEKKEEKKESDEESDDDMGFGLFD